MTLNLDQTKHTSQTRLRAKEKAWENPEENNKEQKISKKLGSEFTQ